MFKLKTLMTCSVILFVLMLLPETAYANSTGVVNCTGYLNFRQTPSTSAKILDKLYPGTKLSIEGSENGWYKVNYNGTNGWVYGVYVSIELPAPPAPPSSENTQASPDTEKTDAASGTEKTDAASNADSSDKAQKIVEYAKKFMGVKYVYGGSSPKGFDCSGLTQYVFREFGISLERRASLQARQGTEVKKSDLKVGDLVFFDTDGGHNSISHVGIYIGDNKIIHAETSYAKSVNIRSLSEGYYEKNYMTARRVIN